MLGPKLDKIKRSHLKYLHYKRKILGVRKDQLTNRDLNQTVTLPNEVTKVESINSKTGPCSQIQQRMSHKFIGTSCSTRKQGEHSIQIKPRNTNPQTAITRNTSVRNYDSKKQTKRSGLNEEKMNSVRRRCKNKNSYNVLSTTFRNDRKESRKYYVRDVKNSVLEFRNNEEFMDQHLTHFIQSIDTFKMFGCSYLPSKPHKIA